MTASLTITSESAPRPDEIAAVRGGLAAYNRQHAPNDEFQPITLIVRDGRGDVAGGLLGGTYWSWLYVEILWLTEELRSHGYGRALLSEAERLAVARGCIAAQLDTMSFQALTFYERQGYTVFGVLEDFPPGHRKYFLHKPLT